MKRGMNVLFLATIFSLFLIGFVCAIPQDISVQGKLTDDAGVALEGTYTFLFRIYDAFTAGNSLWNSGSVDVTTDSNGIYNYILEDVNLNFNQSYYLSVKVGSDDEMTPRINLTSSPYSFRAQNISVAGVEFSSNVDLGSYNITTTGSGFFSYLGSLASRITGLFVQDINASGSISAEGNLTGAYILGDGSYLTGLTSDNSSWNESYADTKYLILSGSNANTNLNLAENDFTADDVTATGMLKGTNLNVTGLIYGNGSQLTDVSTYNSTYAEWAYNQTTPAIAYADANFYLTSNPNAYYNSTSLDLSSYAQYQFAANNFNGSGGITTTGDILANRFYTTSGLFDIDEDAGTLTFNNQANIQLLSVYSGAFTVGESGVGISSGTPFLMEGQLGADFSMGGYNLENIGLIDLGSGGESGQIQFSAGSVINSSDLGNIDIRPIVALRVYNDAYFYGNVTTDSYFIGDGTYLTNLPGVNASFNQTLTDTLYAPVNYGDDWNKTYADGLYAPNTTAGIQALINSTGIYSTYNSTYDAKADYEFGANNFNGSGNVTATYFIGDGRYLTSVNFTETDALAYNGTLAYNSSLANYYLASNPYGFYNSTDFSIADYFTAAEVLAFGYYNSTSFDINDYYLASNPNSYYNSTTLDLSGYVPYSGASTTLDLGSNNVLASELTTDGGITIGGDISGIANSVTFADATALTSDGAGGVGITGSTFVVGAPTTISGKLNATGNITTDSYFVGDGRYLTNLPSTDLSGYAQYQFGANNFNGSGGITTTGDILANRFYTTSGLFDIDEDAGTLTFNAVANLYSLNVGSGVFTIDSDSSAIAIGEGSTLTMGGIMISDWNMNTYSITGLGDGSDTALSVTGPSRLQFRDANINISSADDGHLDLSADTSIDLNAPLVTTSSGNVTITSAGGSVIVKLG